VQQLVHGVAQVLAAHVLGVDIAGGAVIGGLHPADGGNDRRDLTPHVRRQHGCIRGGAVDRGAHGTAGVMPEHHDQRHAQREHRVLQASDDRVRDDLTGVADDE